MISEIKVQSFGSVCTCLMFDFFFFFFMIRENITQAKNELKECYYSKTVNFLLKVTIRGLLIESPEVLSVPRMWQGFSLFCLKFVVTRSDYLQYHIRSFPVWP